MSTSDEHSSFIKTPQQLVVVIVLSFVVPVIGIIMLVQLVMHGANPDPGTLQPEAVAARIQPVGRVEFAGEGGGAAGAGGRSGEQIVKQVCAACHVPGVANAPKIGDNKAWAPHIKQGLPEMLATAIKGIRGMPARGGDASLTDDELARAIVHMVNQSGGKLKEPAAKPAAVQAAGAKPAAADGKKVYDTACMACHATGAANAPKTGDKAAWAPRLKQGADALVAAAIKGKGAMPAKGGNAALSDAEVRAAVEFMVSQSK